MNKLRPETEKVINEIVIVKALFYIAFLYKFYITMFEIIKKYNKDKLIFHVQLHIPVFLKEMILTLSVADQDLR